MTHKTSPSERPRRERTEGKSWVIGNCPCGDCSCGGWSRPSRLVSFCRIHVHPWALPRVIKEVWEVWRLFQFRILIMEEASASLYGEGHQDLTAMMGVE